MQLVLGTVQFGLGYGVAGRATPVPEDEVRAILARAWALGVRTLDTAAAYGDIEARLAGLAEGLPFRVVTKIGPLPAGLDAAAAADWAEAALERSRTRLGGHLHAVLFHRAEDLLEAHGPLLWDRCAAWAERHRCLLGASCYDPITLRRLAERLPVRIAQLPGNALDQRLAQSPPGVAPLELHVRSVFLQGLLLMPRERAAQRVPASATALERWHAWVQAQGLDPLPAALGVAQGLQGATHCVVGVDNVAQLEAIGAAWKDVAPLRASELAVADLDVIDPRRWPPQS
jgi:aryl-alcohol dehydrogenase-like predicted oxidoreductase